MKAESNAGTFEKKCILVAVSFGICGCFERIVAYADDFLFGLVNRDPSVFVSFDLF